MKKQLIASDNLTFNGLKYYPHVLSTSSLDILLPTY